MCFARFPSLALLSLVASAAAMTLTSEGLAHGYYARGYRTSSYRVPYRNDYHGYWRDQGYGFTGNLRGNRYHHRYDYHVPYRSGYQGYWRDQGYGFIRQSRHHDSYRYPNVKWHPRSKPGYPR